MDITDYIELPSWERNRRDRIRRRFATAAGTLAVLLLVERYNNGISRTLKSVKRGLTAALAAWIEDTGGIAMFTPEGEEPPPLTSSVLDLKTMARLSQQQQHQATIDGLTNVQAMSGNVIATGVIDPHDAAVLPGESFFFPHTVPQYFISADTPVFFQSTKFFACLDVEEAKELFNATGRVQLQPNEVLFRNGDPSDSGIFIVVRGTLGVFLEHKNSSTPTHANTLRYGESVGDLDVVDGARRSVTCIALEQGCLLVQVPRALFMAFVLHHPRALLLYLQQGIARLWRVAHFVLSDFLAIELHKQPVENHKSAMSAAAANAAMAAATANRVDADTQTEDDALTSSPSLPPHAQPMGRSSSPLVAHRLAHSHAASNNLQRPHSASSRGIGSARVGTGAASPSSADDDLDMELDNLLPATQAPHQSLAHGPLNSELGRRASDSASSYHHHINSFTRMSFDGNALGVVDEVHSGSLGSESSMPTPTHLVTCSPAPSLPTFGELLAATQAAASPANRHLPLRRTLTLEQQRLSNSMHSVSSPLSASSFANSGFAAGGFATAGSGFATAAAAAAAAAERDRERSGRSSNSQQSASQLKLASPVMSPVLQHQASVAAAAAAAAAVTASGLPGGRPSPLSASPPISGLLSLLSQEAPKDLISFVTGTHGDGFLAGSPQTSVGSSINSHLTAPQLSGGAIDVGGSAPAGSPPSKQSHAQPSPPVPQPSVFAQPAQRPPSRSGDGRSSSGHYSGSRGRAPTAAGPYCRMGRTSTLRSAFVLGARACLEDGWDVISVEELQLDEGLWEQLSDPRQTHGQPFPIPPGGLLHDIDWASGCCYLLLEGHLLAERQTHGTEGQAVQESAIISPGSLISCAAFLSSTTTRCKVVALEPSKLVSFGWHQMEALVTDAPTLLVTLLLAAATALGPVIRRFISMGLNRVWLESGDVAYRQGEAADCLFVVISGRLRLMHETEHPVTHKMQLRIEEEVGRGEAVGAVWAITGGAHDTTAVCVRDSELVRMSKSAFKIIAEDSPLALSKLFSNIARRLVAAWDSRVRSDRVDKAGVASAPPLAGGSIGGGVMPGGSNGLTTAGPISIAPLPSGLLTTQIQRLPAVNLSTQSFSAMAPPRLGSIAAAAGGKGTNSATGGGAAGVGKGGRDALKASNTSRRGEIVTIAVLPAGRVPEGTAAETAGAAAAGSAADAGAAAAAIAAGLVPAGGAGLASAPGMATLVAIKRLSMALKVALGEWGPVQLLNSTSIGLLFPTAFERLDVLFYRSKITSWMASQEEEFRFIILEADAYPTPWSSVCVAQADCILLVAPEGSTHDLGSLEASLVFNMAPSHPPRPSGMTPHHLTPAVSSAQLHHAHGTATSTLPSAFGSIAVTSTTSGGSLTSPTASVKRPSARAGSSSRSLPAGGGGSRTSNASSVAEATTASTAALSSVGMLPSSTTGAGVVASSGGGNAGGAATSAGQSIAAHGSHTTSRIGQQALGRAQRSLDQRPAAPSLVRLHSNDSEYAASGSQATGSTPSPFSAASGSRPMPPGLNVGEGSRFGGSIGMEASSGSVGSVDALVGSIGDTFGKPLAGTLGMGLALRPGQAGANRSSFVADASTLGSADAGIASSIMNFKQKQQDRVNRTQDSQLQLVQSDTSDAGSNATKGGSGGGGGASSGIPTGASARIPRSSPPSFAHRMPPNFLDLSEGLGSTYTGDVGIGSHTGGMGASNAASVAVIDSATSSADGAVTSSTQHPVSSSAVTAAVQPLQPPQQSGAGGGGAAVAAAPCHTAASGSSSTTAGVLKKTPNAVPASSFAAAAYGHPSYRLPQAAASMLLPSIGGTVQMLQPGSSHVNGASAPTMRPSPAQLRRVELVLLHSSSGDLPQGTSDWLKARPHLTRHHHLRLGHAPDIARLSRWMAGKAVGLVLSGGGSRGLAHLGVLCALEDVGIPVDVVGGTSQGAFMAALYAQGQDRERLQSLVREYAARMGSVRHLLSDLTLPILSVFSGTSFDETLQHVFGRGAGRIEDLWLPFFCVTTNLSRGEPSVHQQGVLWRLVRASMTIVGLLPPMFEDGDLLVDGGYMNNIPVDVMRSLGVETVIVVDVEGKDDMGWRNLTPYDGGVSGWKLLWDRWCPIPSWKSGVRMPKYSQIINQLTWMTHAHNLKRVSEDYQIDLYLRPPNINSFKLMDYHLMDRIVKDSYRYAYGAVTHWKSQTLSALSRASTLARTSLDESAARDLPNAVGGGSAAAAAAGLSLHTMHSTTLSGGGAVIPGMIVPSGNATCMTQLQKKAQAQAALDAASSGASGVPGGGSVGMGADMQLVPGPGSAYTGMPIGVGTEAGVAMAVDKDSSMASGLVGGFVIGDGGGISGTGGLAGTVDGILSALPAGLSRSNISRTPTMRTLKEHQDPDSP